MMLTSRTIFQTKNYKVILNLIQDLPYKLFCKKQFNNKNQRLTGKIPNQVWNDFYNTTARGFTLIELLVVVLIIGILAAVALPQYQVAVAKARFANLQTIVHSIKNAEERYYLANNKYTYFLTDMDIDFACPYVQTNLFTCDNYFLIDTLPGDQPKITAWYCPKYTTSLQTCTAHTDFTYILFLDNSSQPGKKTCDGETALGKAVCKSMI